MPLHVHLHNQCNQHMSSPLPLTFDTWSPKLYGMVTLSSLCLTLCNCFWVSPKPTSLHSQCDLSKRHVWLCDLDQLLWLCLVVFWFGSVSACNSLYPFTILYKDIMHSDYPLLITLSYLAIASSSIQISFPYSRFLCPTEFDTYYLRPWV